MNLYKDFALPVPNPPNPVVVVAGLLPNAPKPVDVPKPVEAVFAVPNPPNRLGVDVVVVVPNPPKPPKLNVDVVDAVPKPPKPVVEAGVLPNVEVVPNPVVVEDTGVVPKAGAEPKALVDAVPNVGADPKPVLGALPKPVAVGVPNAVPVPNPVVCVDGVPKRLGVEVVGVLNPNEGVPNPATLKLILNLKIDAFSKICKTSIFIKLKLFDLFLFNMKLGKSCQLKGVCYYDIFRCLFYENNF